MSPWERAFPRTRALGLTAWRMTSHTPTVDRFPASK